MPNQATARAFELPNGRLPERDPVKPADLEALRSRVRELETLCAEVYVAAVELGLPQPLLNRLWTVAAQGSSPHAFALDMPAKAPAPPPAQAKVEQMPIPDIRLTDRPLAGKGSEPRTRPALTDLKALPARRTLLVVDDDPMMLEVLVRILQRENYEILTAADGPEALDKAAAHGQPIDLLVTDYAMPEMKGRELAERMRARYPAIRVLYQTGFSDMLFEDRVELEDGSAFLEKPFTARGLREAARLILFGSLNPEAGKQVGR